MASPSVEHSVEQMPHRRNENPSFRRNIHFFLPVQLLQECPKAKCRIFIHIAVTSRSSETVMRVLSLPILFSTPATSRGTQRTIEQRVLHSVNISKKKETATKIVASPPAKKGEKTMKHFVPLDVKTEKKFSPKILCLTSSSLSDLPGLAGQRKIL